MLSTVNTPKLPVSDSFSHSEKLDFAGVFNFMAVFWL